MSLYSIYYAIKKCLEKLLLFQKIGDYAKKSFWFLVDPIIVLNLLLESDFKIDVLLNSTIFPSSITRMKSEFSTVLSR